MISVVSPVDGRTVSTHRLLTDAEIESALVSASQAARSWRQIPLGERQAHVHRLIDELLASRESLAESISWSIGRPRTQADESGAFDSGGRYLIGLANAALRASALEHDDQFRRIVAREPYGVTFAICAWNYPVSLCVPLVIPTLVAGNVVLLKHAPQTTAIGDALAAAAHRAALPPGVFQHLAISNDQAARVVADERVRLISFVGSERGGRAVHAAIGHNFKPAILELGGKDAVYVRADADVVAAADAIALGAFGNSGQSCCSVERIYVARAIAEHFTDALAARTRQISLGNPFDERAHIGPVVSSAAAQRISAHVDDAVGQGARVVARGARLEELFATSAYVDPIVIDRVPQRCALMQEETFGPVAALHVVDSDDQAVALMNDSRFGLTGAIYTADLELGLSLGDKLDVGSVTINECNYPDAYLPWGGVKASGIGRTDGDLAYDSVTQTKSFFAKPLRSISR
jgi:acyl-CoA reductase-like NAD-dependent aldehyde dehydrogenase